MPGLQISGQPVTTLPRRLNPAMLFVLSAWLDAQLLDGIDLNHAIILDNHLDRAMLKTAENGDQGRYHLFFIDGQIQSARQWVHARRYPLAGENDTLILPSAAPLSLVFVSTLSTIGYEEYIPYQRSYVNAPAYLFGGHLPASAMDQALEALARLGKDEQVEHKTGQAGRPLVCWRIGDA